MTAILGCLLLYRNENTPKSINTYTPFLIKVYITVL